MQSKAFHIARSVAILKYGFLLRIIVDSLCSDQPYILAFSMIMLHTDAFNKSNKRKMSRADYVRNTTIEGISPNLLIVGYIDNDSELI